MRVVRLSARRREEAGALGLHGRLAAFLDGTGLRFADLGDEDPLPFASVEGVEAFAIGAPWSGSDGTGATIAASLTSGELAVVRVEEGRARPLARLDPKALALGGTGPATEVVLSKSARYAAVSFPVRDPQRVGVALVDLHDGTVHGWFRPSLAMRAGFATLPSGTEVLLIAADSYLDVKLVECATGRTLAAYDATSSFDFVHVAFALSDDATRLYTWGCIWGAPYEVRVYDARPWTDRETEGAPIAPGPGPRVRAPGDSPGPFPLPLVFRDDHVIGTSTPAFPTKTPDGAFTHVSLVAGELPDEEQLAWIERRSPAEGQVRRWWIEKTVRSGLVIRRVDPKDARVLGWSAHALATPKEERVHVVDGHRVVVFGERVLRLAEELEDFGRVEGDVVATGATRDGEVAVVVTRD